MNQRQMHFSPAAIVGLISLPIFIGALDLTVVSAVLPHVVYDLEIPLQSGLDDAAWVVSGYLLAYTVAMTFMGSLSDRAGRQRVYLLALAIFALGSYLVAVADGWPTDLALQIAYRLGPERPDPAYLSLWMLVLARMVQAFGGGAMVPVGMAIAGDLYPPGRRARPLGVIAAVDTAGWVVGHLYGGILTRYFDWRVIFWMNLPLCLAAFLMIYFALADLPRLPETVGRMDWSGAALISLALAALNLGLGTGAEQSSMLSLGGVSALPRFAPGYLALATLFFILFLWRQRGAANPLMPPALFRRPNFSAAGLSNFLIGVGLFIAIANVPLFINTLVAETLEQGAWDSGWMLSALTVPMALASVPGGWLTHRWGYRPPALAGLILATTGFLLMTSWQPETTYLAMIPQLALTGVGYGLTLAPIAAAVIDTSPPGQRGAASGLVIIFRLVGMTVGVSALATYGLQRANFLGWEMLGPSADLTAAARVGMQIATQVISETFLIAAVVSVFAILPSSVLKPLSTERGKP
ncbi:MAG TPA: MFS transporter [Anaerolineales bacterium]|nr:MFS transporter [Anaerolineales bacterium]